MYTNLYVTPEMASVIDPTGRGKAFLLGMKASDGTPVPPEYAHLSRDEWLSRWLDSPIWKNLGKRHAPYVEFARSMIPKYGTQGIQISREHLMQLAAEYYPDTLITEVESEAFYAGLQYLLQRIILRKDGITTAHATIKKVSTLAGLTTMCHKGGYMAETVGMKPWRHMNPMLPGQRYQRNSPRCIFIDDNTNVTYINESLSKVRNFLKDTFPEYFSGWIRPDQETGPRIYQAIRRKFASVEADYEKCDQHIAVGIARALFPIYEVCMEPADYYHFVQAVEELFEQPLYWGDRLWVGPHALFSGQTITNDIETLFDICLMIGVLLLLSIDPESCTLVANGDDLAIILPPRWVSMASKVLELYSSEAAICGHVISASKSRISYTDVRFCKRVYYTALPTEYNSEGLPFSRGAYPTPLALNSSINPERFESDPMVRLVSDLQRTDNCAGNPDYTEYAQFLFSRRRDKHSYTYEQLDSVELPLDWWDRLYGESFSLASSRTYRLLKSGATNLI